MWLVSAALSGAREIAAVAVPYSLFSRTRRMKQDDASGGRKMERNAAENLPELA